MALSCNREAFKPADGCPEIHADLTFPDFESCEAADPGRLKSVSRLDLQKTPAFPMFVPANDPLPVSIPDIDIDIDEIGCIADDLADGSSSVSISYDVGPNDKPYGSVSIARSTDNSCSISGINIALHLIQPSIPSVSLSDGVITYSFTGVSL